METEGNPSVLVILGLLSAGVGAYLYFWSRGQSRSIRRFAESRGLVYRSRDEEGLEQRVNEAVALEGPDLTRIFSRVGDVVSLGNGTLFRAVELLDLSPWGRSEYVNKPRVAVMFRCSSQTSGIFLVTPVCSVHQRYPETPEHTGDLKALLEDARVPSPPCPLSLTVMRGHILAYLEPVVNGFVSRTHLEYLAGLPDRLLDRRR